MKQDREAELEALLKGFAERTRHEQQARVEHERQRRDFFEAFQAVKATRIRPVMDAFGEQLNAHGQRFEVHETGGDQTASPAIHPMIELRVYPDLPERPADTLIECPWVRFEAHGESLYVHVHTSTVVPGRGGSTGSRGDYDLDEVTSELVEQEIMEVLRKVFGGPA